jgi:hypothetical protein
VGDGGAVEQRGGGGHCLDHRRLTGWLGGWTVQEEDEKTTGDDDSDFDLESAQRTTRQVSIGSSAQPMVA